MNAEERRKFILSTLGEANKAISGSQISKTLGVSRQIIVGDIALLRAGGKNIISTPKGYILNDMKDSTDIVKTIACRHNKNCTEDELNIIVDEGATVVNVIVEHDVYGQITGDLYLSSRRDVKDFMKKLNDESINPLSQLTDGIHLHTIKCKSEEVLKNVIYQLNESGYLL